MKRNHQPSDSDKQQPPRYAIFTQSAIGRQWMEQMSDQIDGAYGVVAMGGRRVELSVRNDFQLALVVWYVMQQFIRQGKGFDRLHVRLMPPGDDDRASIELTVAPQNQNKCRVSFS